jgi:NADP-dependent aldehyde dehydrogenase
MPVTTEQPALDDVIDAAVQAHRPWAATPVAQRRDTLGVVADALDAAADELIPVAQRETNLPTGRLVGELTRTTFQLRLLGAEIVRGDCFDARLDSADPEWPMGAPRPDMRRVKIPMGPVLVFAASNFPFAFSVAGGDTASALAAGCPVVVKAHPGHPELSRRTAEIVTDALRRSGAPDGVFALIEGRDIGVDALRHPGIAAGAFTGSIAGGRFLFDVASQREVPIPFFGELGSVNPVFVTPEAAATLRDDVIAGFVASFTLGSGQFCTKPGLLIAPAGSGLAEDLARAELPAAAPMLNDAIRDGYRGRLRELLDNNQISLLSGAGDTAGDVDAPVLLRADAEDVINSPALREECFGPAAVVVEYTDTDQLVSLAQALEGQLTATIWGTDDSEVTELVTLLSGRAGRLLWNQWPTGVSVTHAQQHGGPYPATTAAATTSVGTAAIERFLRPVAYQNFPQHLLPAALRDDNPLQVRQRTS